jgi:hypothetical protein
MLLLLLLWRTQSTQHTYFDPSTSDGSFATGHMCAHINVCVACAPVVCPRPSMCRLSGRLKHYILLEREPNAHDTPSLLPPNETRHATPRMQCDELCARGRERERERECVQATRTKTMYHCLVSLYLSIYIDRETHTHTHTQTIGS